ncbi:MAG TPA: hypothetical protein VFS18_04550, partial [Actinomycetota bacterium]|nr:hypothetical protein [Actinomycetota bacterium]
MPAADAAGKRTIITRGTTLHRTVKRLALLAVTGLSVLGATLPAPAAPAVETPDGEIMIVTANLDEAYTSQDMQNLGEMKIFAKRLKAQVPFAPDVLLLQEVRDRSATKVARLMRKKFNQRYIVAVNPGSPPTKEFGRKQIHKETAIVINTATIAKRSKGGYIATEYDRSAAAPGAKIVTRKNAHLLVEEKSSDVRVAVASIHFNPAAQMKSSSVSDRNRGRWAREIATALNNKYPAAAHDNIGGDFNSDRCKGTQVGDNCTLNPFWKILTADFGYVDSVREAKRDESGGV